MDVHTEKKILENIAALNITRIMVTHRHGAALYADRIYDVARGEYWPKEDRAALRNETAVMAR
jgi:ABC-type bacteriocin/lantibiotic exporter with double-glycine peptidase domain